MRSDSAPLQLLGFFWMAGNYGERAMGDNEQRLSAGRRAGQERRSGIDTRLEQEKQSIGERRSDDRRSGQDRRAGRGASDRSEPVRKI
jgi:hypothetical protein